MEKSKLIEKYLRGECLPHEKLLLEKYLDSFQNPTDTPIEGDEADKEILQAKIYSEIIRKIQKEEINIFKKMYYSPYFIKIAAAILLFISLASAIFILSGSLERKAEVITQNEKRTEPGEKSTLTFSDGTKIILNSGSKLKYPDKFGTASREVFLEGEAFFEVAPDADKAFIVRTGSLSVTVLGTKFNVCAFPDEKEIAVSLVEGKVRIQKSNPVNNNDTTYLIPTQQFVYSKQDDNGFIQPFDLLETSGWKDNILQVTDEPLEKVFIKLERFFGVKFRLSNKSFSDIKITANFRYESFETALKIIKKLTGMNYKKSYDENQNVMIIYY